MCMCTCMKLKVAANPDRSSCFGVVKMGVMEVDSDGVMNNS